MGTAIEKSLAEAGYRMLGDEDGIEKLILNILKTKNIRYLKAIPFLIYKHKVNISKSNDLLSRAIIAITAKLFQEFNITGILSEGIEDNAAIKQSGLDYKEFRDEFELQLRNEAKPSLLIEKQKIYAERDLQVHLSRIFTRKEKQILRRLLEEKPISRTDYEYYSRKTKKKLSSIIGLQDFAKTLYTKTPKCDEELFRLKKMLEEWLLNNYKVNEASILEFSLQDNGKLSISYKDSSGEQLFSSVRIKDKEIFGLLNKYKQHNFR